jgi:alpha-mannosidase
MPNQTHTRTVHLLCNSHLDPVWLWEWPEGAGEALSLARTVCDLCNEFEGFVFNRNEVQFYEWIEEYDQELFERIKQLVRRGQWHIMGGWYLQPDCNMPSGESLVRQILVGKRYFKKKFGVEPTTAANLDPFGHTRGLVQILRKGGYDSYLFCRPKLHEAPLPAAEFIWEGYDGSEVIAAVAESHYNSPPGAAREKIEDWMERDATKPVYQVQWGVGNHGGGPSRMDLKGITKLMGKEKEAQIIHSTPESYFADLRENGPALPRHSGDLNPWAVGCYTSMMRVKRLHRKLENELFAAERLATTAWAAGLLSYPTSELAETTRAMLANEFHDILPGTSIPSVEESVLAELGHGLTLASRVRTRAFFALTAGQRPGKEGSYPILVYNHHPFPIETIVECELQPASPDRADQFGVPAVTVGRRSLAAQAEEEESNINEDHRKRVVFAAKLAPGKMNRFECRLEKKKRKPASRLREQNGRFRFRTADLDVIVNARSGLIDRYKVRGKDYLRAGALAPLVMFDNADPWGITVTRFRTSAGRFRLMSQSDAARFAGVTAKRLPAVRVIEDGSVRSVIEALFRYEHSTICQRYKLPRVGTELEIETRVYWQEKDRMLKLSFPTPWPDSVLLGQVAYGVEELPNNGNEVVAQKWTAAVSHDNGQALSVINDTTYGCDLKAGELRLSLLRSPAHACHPTFSGRPLTQPDRLTPRVDQGEHRFRFWLNGGAVRDRLQTVDREASTHNEQPFALSYWPSGDNEAPCEGPRLSDRAVQLTTFKRTEDGSDLIVRLFEPTGRRRKTTLSLPSWGKSIPVQMGPFELKTLRINLKSGRAREVSLLEE